MQINDLEYFTPWFSGFAKDDAGVNKSYELDLFFNIEIPADGDIRLNCENENIEVVFSDTGNTSFKLTTGSAKKIDKKVKITFLDYITEHTCITVSFHKKTEEEKLEEKKRAEDDKTGKKNSDLPTLYLVTGQLIGVLNLYKNSIEYVLNFRYVKIFFKGWIEGYDDKIYLSKRNPKGLPPDYEENESLIKKQNKLSRQIDDLKHDLILEKKGAGGLFTSEAHLKAEIATKQTKLTDLENLCNKRLKLSEDIYNFQTINMSKYESNINLWKPFFIDAFSQAIVKYKEVKSNNYEEMEIDVKEMNSLFDDLKLTKTYNLVDDDDEVADSERIKGKVIKAFKPNEREDKKEFITFLLPFGIISNIKDGLVLAGSAEDVSYDADSAVLTPQTNRSTFVHEAGHTFDLSHTFLRRGGSWLFGSGIKIEQGTTDNIMDYGHSVDKESKLAIIKDKIALWKFQWDKIHEDPNLIKNIIKI
ncbi:hypothetical protein HNQ02_003638 [Flavobacterium sp. 7E]|uniref:reprolysin-like metallopeptidase n=1 Tax=Flavobacterium sp. 7E TaxID=2735898 RepID=UPI00157076BE|nr:hypothetical protein [Flavobacterium sp. 7E]NRS90691.1 hypothetical protein [Flavobacterium sp. 7E]